MLAIIGGSGLTQLANMLQWAMIFGGGRDNNDDGPGIGAELAMMIVAPLAATLVQLAISRSREFEADHTGALISGRPLSLANALMRLEEGVERQPMDANPAIAHMYIVNPFAGAGGLFRRLFSTHPSTEERVQRLQAMARGVTY